MVTELSKFVSSDLVNSSYVTMFQLKKLQETREFKFNQKASNSIFKANQRQ